MFFSSRFITGTVLLSGGTILSYILGFVREMIFGRVYGTSIATDAYFSAFVLGDFLLMALVSSALLGLITPLFLREREVSPEHGNRVFGNFFGVLNGIFVLVILVAGIFMEEILSILFPVILKNTGETFVTLVRCVLCANFIFAISNFLGTFLMSFRHFWSTALSPIFYNVGIIMGVVFFAHDYGILAAGGGVIFGAFLHLFCRLLEYFIQPERFFPHANFQDPVLRELLSSMVLKAMSITALPVLLFLFSNIATQSAEGMYTAFLYARNLQSAPVSIFGIAFATAVFPILSSHSAKKELSHFSEKFWNTAGKILFWSIPAMVGILMLGTTVLRILYKFPPESHSLQWISSFLLFLSIAIPLESLYHLLSRAFHAKGDAQTPLYTNGIFLLFGGGIAIGMQYFSPTLALGMGYLGGFLAQILFFVWQSQKLSLSAPPPLFWKNLKISVFASILMGICLWIFPSHSVTELAINIGMGIIVFGGVWKISFSFMPHFTLSQKS
ncbi:MAG: lipid II flippase MurJ [Candidatus Peregrinibacteria bacterium]